MKSIRRNLPGCLLFIALMLGVTNSAQARSNDPLYESLTNLRRGQKFYGIVLRTLPNTYVVALPDEVREYSRDQVRRSTRSPREVKEVDGLLTGIENSIRNSRFLNAQSDLPRLKEAIDQFDEMVAPKLRATTSSDEFKAAIRQAQAHYRKKYSSIKPTIRALELSRDMQKLITEIDQQRKIFSEALLLEMATSLHELKSIEEEIPLAARERERAVDAMKTRIQGCIKALSNNAVAGFKANWDIGNIRDLLQTLEKCHEFDPDYAAAQKPLLTRITKTSGTFAKTLPSTAREIFDFDGDVVVDLEDYKRATKKLRQINWGLKELESQVFGPNEKALRKLLDDQREANEKLRAEADAIRDRIYQIRMDFSAADRMRLKGDYREAIAAYGKLDETLKASQLDVEQMRNELKRFMLKSRALDLLTRLRSTASLPAEEFAPLAEDVDSFLLKHPDDLETLGLRIEDYQQKLQEVKSYLRFRKRLNVLQEQFDEFPKITWVRIEELSASLDDKYNRLPARAEEELRAFLQDRQEDAYKNVVEVFKEEGIDWGQKRDEDVWLGALAYVLSQGRRIETLDLLTSTIKKIDRSHKDPFANKLIELTLKTSRELTRAGNHAATDRAYKLLREKFPGYAQEQSFKDRLVEMLLIKAEAHLADDEPDAALATYNQICDDYPNYATAKIFDSLFGLKQRQDLELCQDQDAWFTYLEGYAQKFGRKLSSVAAVTEAGSRIEQEFRTSWDAGNWEAAAKDLLSFHNRFPKLLKQSGAVDRIMAFVKQDLAPLVSDKNQLAQAELIDSLAILAARDFRRSVSRHGIDQIFVQLKLRQANRLLEISQMGSVEKAYDIFKELQWRFPDLAREYGVDQKMREFVWNRRLDLFRQPMGIYSRLDWIALAAWILFWIAYFLRSIRVGRRFGHLHYSLWHFLTVFLSFIVLLAAFLFGAQGHFSHLLAAGLALVIPSFLFTVFGLFNGFGIFPYVFFPLIYGRRRLNLYRLGMRIGKRLPGVRERLTPLAGQIEQLETDLPLLHNRWLFRIARSARLAETDPEAAFKRFQTLLEKLEKEVFKDESWQEHHMTCLFNLGQLAWALNREQEALDYLNQHLEEDPRSNETRELLAEIHYKIGQYEEAIPHLKACLATKNESDELWYCLGRCFFEVDKYKSAFKCFETMQERSRDALFYGARAFARANMMQRSIEWYQKLLKANANDGEAIYYLASGFAHQGEDVKAFKIIDLIKEDNPFYPQALALQGALLLRNRKTAKAKEYYDAALEYDSALPAALLGCGQIALENGAEEEAETHFSHLLVREPENAAANYYYGVLLEKREPPTAIEHFARAIDHASFRRQAANHTGRIHFFQDDYGKSIEYFEIAEEAGERSPWFLYLYAYALACEEDIAACEQVLIKILGHSSKDPNWQRESAKAMYSIGYRLFEQHDYHMASQCFEYVKQNSDDEKIKKKLDELLEETNFRTILELTRKGDYLGAMTMVAELQLATQDKTRYAVCRYYTALCHLFQEDFDNAFSVLSDLAMDNPDPRYEYHLAVAEVGRGNRQQAESLMEKLRQESDVPTHIRIGIETVKAYLLALDDQQQEAEQSLAGIKELAEDFPGKAYAKQKVLLSRAFYLCQIQDSTRLQFLMAEMNPDSQSKAAYLQALSCLEGGHLSAAINNLRPFADQSDANIRLYTSLGTDLANMAIRDSNLKRATEILESIPEPPASIIGALEALRMAKILKSAEDVEGISQAVLMLRGGLIKTKDRLLKHSIIHNLGILTLRLAMLVEDTRDKANVEECWQNFWNFWEQNIFTNTDYWNRAVERLNGDQQTVRPFAEDELKNLNAAFREDILMPIFLGFVTAYITETNGQSDLIRHLNYFTAVGEQNGKLDSYMKRLGKDAKDYVDSLDKSDPVLKTWDFVINYMRVQVAVAEINQPDDVPHLQAQLETYIEFRNHYASPADFMQAKKVFNTELLDALQQGMNGKFSSVGDKLDAILSDVPHGINIEPIEDLLWQMRQYCRKPSRAAERGINLVYEFERTYQRVVNFTMQKGK